MTGGRDWWILALSAGIDEMEERGNKCAASIAKFLSGHVREDVLFAASPVLLCFELGEELIW